MPSKIPFPNTKRNPLLSKGLERFGRHASYVRKGSWAVKNRNKAVAKKADVKVAKVKPFGKKGETRTLKRPRTPFWVPATKVAQPLRTKNKNNSTQTAKLRPSITPGTILILVAGRFQGNRVIFLKQLASGLLLVTGPFKINGVPLRRVNQRFAIATSTKIDISGIKVDKFDDVYFKKALRPKEKKSENTFFAEKKTAEQKKKEINPQKIEDQKAIDASILPIVKKTPELATYLGTKFSLRHGQYPHMMKF